MANRIPTIVKHTTLAIYNKDKTLKGRTEAEKFQSAWNVARFRLTQYGFLVTGSEKGSPDQIMLTGRGRLREAEHKRESDSTIKDRMFDELFSKLSEVDAIGEDDCP